MKSSKCLKCLECLEYFNYLVQFSGEKIGDCKKDIRSGLAFFSCGCNQHKFFHQNITVQSKQKKSELAKKLSAGQMSEYLLEVALLFLKRKDCEIIPDCKIKNSRTDIFFTVGFYVPDILCYFFHRTCFAKFF